MEITIVAELVSAVVRLCVAIGIGAVAIMMLALGSFVLTSGRV